MTKKFYSKPCKNKAKLITKLPRNQPSKLVELVTGQNNLNYLLNKIYGTKNLCRFREEEEETFDHLINNYPYFYTLTDMTLYKIKLTII